VLIDIRDGYKMAEINQPTPIKPAWPIHREERPVKRRLPEAEEDREKKQRKRNDDNGRKPLLDDYA